MKLTDEIKSDIIKRYLYGESSIKISKVYNISQGLISKYIREKNLTRDRSTELSKDKKLQEEVRRLYLEGLGSTTISKNLNIPYHNIKYFLRKENIVRNSKVIDKSLYNGFWFDNGKWWGYRQCPKCGSKVLSYAQSEYYLYRNNRRKTKHMCLCKECYSEVYSGEGNSFYGQKHTKETITKMLINQHKVIKPISKAEKEILKKLQPTMDVEPQFVLEGKSFDFYVPKYNLLIEYNGDYWHCNPELYDENYYHKKKRMKSIDIWEYDSKKIELSEKYGYNLEVVWERDYKTNPNIIFDKISKYE